MKKQRRWPRRVLLVLVLSGKIQARTLILAGRMTFQRAWRLLPCSLSHSGVTQGHHEGDWHLLQIEKPEESNQHLVEFIDTVSRGGA